MTLKEKQTITADTAKQQVRIQQNTGLIKFYGNYMPLKSKKQATYLRINKPTVYRKLADPKYKKVAKKFKPHKMYKGTIVKTAKTNAEHLKLKTMGYTHTKLKKVYKKK